MLWIVFVFPLSFSGTWSSPPVRGTRPPPCCNFSLTKFDDDHVVLFGGEQSKVTKTKDAYLLDLKKMVSHVL